MGACCGIRVALRGSTELGMPPNSRVRRLEGAQDSVKRKNCRDVLKVWPHILPNRDYEHIMTTSDLVVARAAQAAFGRPRVMNVLRSLLVESAVSLALPRECVWCGADYAAHDVRHTYGTRLEV
jgi:hypothetical protein